MTVVTTPEKKLENGFVGFARQRLGGFLGPYNDLHWFWHRDPSGIVSQLIFHRKLTHGDLGSGIFALLQSPLLELFRGKSDVKKVFAFVSYRLYELNMQCRMLKLKSPKVYHGVL